RLRFRGRGRTMRQRGKRLGDRSQNSPVGRKTMRSRIRFAVALCLGLCAAMPAPAQTFRPDKADVEAARREGTLSWYTSTPFPLVQHLVDKFQQETGVKIQLLRSGGQAVLRRFQQEAAAGRPGADVMTMSDAGAANGLV